MVKRVTDEELNKLPEENRLRVIGVKAKYGDNNWWDADDLRILAYYQLKEDTLIVPFHEFQKGVMQLLGRPVWTNEFSSINITGLIEESEKAYVLVQSGESTDTSPEYKFQKFTESMRSLQNFADKNNS